MPRKRSLQIKKTSKSLSEKISVANFCQVLLSFWLLQSYLKMMQALRQTLRTSLLTQRCQFNFGMPQILGPKAGPYQISYLHYFKAGSVTTIPQLNKVILGPISQVSASVYVVVDAPLGKNYLQDQKSGKYLRVTDQGNDLVGDKSQATLLSIMGHSSFFFIQDASNKKYVGFPDKNGQIELSFVDFDGAMEFLPIQKN